jgi:hypothetical protein
MKQKGKKRVGRIRVKKRDKAMSASVKAWHYSVMTLLDYVSQRGFKYSDVTAAEKICTAVRRKVKSHKNKWPLHYF